MSEYLYLSPKLLNFQGDKYQLILLSLRHARAMKAKGTPETMPSLVDKALSEILEGKISKEEIMASKIPATVPVEEIPAVVSVADDGASEAKAAMLAADDSDDDEKKSKKKKKKDE